MAGRPSRAVVAAEIAALFGALAVIVLTRQTADWDLTLLAVLLGFSIVSDVAAVNTPGNVKISGSFLALVLAMVFLGGTPAALIGLATIAVGWLRWRDVLVLPPEQPGHLRLVPAARRPRLPRRLPRRRPRPLRRLLLPDGLRGLRARAGGQLPRSSPSTGATSTTPRCSTRCERSSSRCCPRSCRRRCSRSGSPSSTSRSASRRSSSSRSSSSRSSTCSGSCWSRSSAPRSWSVRTRQLASLQVGLLSALLHTLDLRDRMTARHSAAVARYAKEIAAAAGLLRGGAGPRPHGRPPPRRRQVHLPRPHPEGRRRSSPTRTGTIIRMHPYQGAKIVSQIEGYGPVGEIILAHHERIDGTGYPRSLKGEEIPPLARIISVADIYDVMTAQRLLPRADLVLRGDHRAQARGRHAARRPFRRGVHRGPRRQGRQLPPRRGRRLRRRACARQAGPRVRLSGLGRMLPRVPRSRARPRTDRRKSRRAGRAARAEANSARRRAVTRVRRDEADPPVTGSDDYASRKSAAARSGG